MKIASFLLFFSLYTLTFWLGNTIEDFNTLYEQKLQNAWRKKIQEKSGLSLFDEARQEVQNTLKIPKDTKPTEAIFGMWNTFCRWLYGTCDENSIHARLLAGCETARDEAMQEMSSDFIKNSTKLLLASYTSCQELATDVLFAHKDSASIGIAKWKGKNSKDSQEAFMEKSQNNFQEKVSGPWDTFKKKLTNFVRSIQGFTKEVFK